MDSPFPPDFIRVFSESFGLDTLSAAQQKDILDTFGPQICVAFITSLIGELTPEQQEKVTTYLTSNDPEGLITYLNAIIPNLYDRFIAFLPQVS